MKKAISILIIVVIVLSLTACMGDSSAGQTITFQGITLNIPKNWKADKYNSEDYAVYEKKNSSGHEYKLQFMDTFGLLDTFDNDMDRAGDFFKEVTEDDASYRNPSDPVAGKLDGKYNMHIIECTFCVINPSKDGKEAKYPCKLVRIYMGDHDVEIQFSSAEGDFEAFDTALANATCN